MVAWMSAFFDWVKDPNNLTAISTLIIALFTVVLAIVGWCQARLINKSIKLARDEFNATHRPKIIARAFDLLSGPPISSRDNFDIVFIAHNAGDGRGTVVEIRSAKVILNLGEKIPGNWGFPFKETFDVVLDSGEKEIFPLNSGITNQSVGGQEGIMHNSTILYSIGVITYLDGGGRKRQTGFCRKYLPESNTWEVVEGEYEYAY